ncbi:MAG: hypothetical protein M5U13_12345 [Thermoanaerobaculia bacterium]|nr:hypothetical protein [Thermoanaerobaculia bacterium]
MSGVPSPSRGNGFRNACRRPDQIPSPRTGTKFERKSLSATVACTVGTAAEANDAVRSTISEKMFCRAATSSSLFWG